MSNSTTEEAPFDFQMWHYNPSLPAAVIAIIIFAVLTIWHVFRLFRSRTWFCIPFIIGGLLEVIGYVGRALCHNNTESTGPYIIQSLLLLIAPPFFAASIYMILSRIIRVTGSETLSIIRPTRVTIIFVCGDVACFLIQAAGGGVQASGDATSFKTGEDIVLAGLILQIVVFFFFLVVAGVWHYRLRQIPTKTSLSSDLPWERLMWILYCVSVLITIRNLVRVVEYAMGNDGYLLTHEWVLYVFDGLLMAVTLFVCLTWYNRDIQPQNNTSEEIELGEQTQEPKIRV